MSGVSVQPVFVGCHGDSTWGQQGKALPRLDLATWGPSLSGRAFGSLALPRGGAAVGGRARGGLSPELSAGGTRTNETAARQPRTPEAAGQSPKGGRAPDPHAHDEEHQGDAIGGESSKAVARR